MDVIEGFVPCGHPALTVSNALVALDADDDAALAQQLETVEGLIDHVSENRGVTAYHGIEDASSNDADSCFGRTWWRGYRLTRTVCGPLGRRCAKGPASAIYKSSALMPS